jgi:transposase
LVTKNGIEIGQKFSSLTPEVLEEAKREYLKLKEGRIAKKLLAIMGCSEHSAQEVGNILKVSKYSIYEWINKFKERGVEGLKETRGGNYPQKLSDEQWDEVKEIVILGC